MWRLGVLASALSADLREAMELASACGAEGVQLAVGAGGSGGERAGGGADDTSLKALSRSGRRELLKRLEMQRLGLLSLVTTCGRRGFSPGADVDRVLEHLRTCIELAAELGRVVLCVDAGPLPPPPPSAATFPSAPTQATGGGGAEPLLLGGLVLPTAEEKRRFAQPARPTASEPRDEAFEAQLDAAWREVGALADRCGVRVAWRSGLASWRSLKRALDAAGCPMFGVDFDPVSVLGEPEGWDGMEAAVGALAGRVWHVRVRDALRGSGGRTQPAPPGRGSLDWRALRQWLLDADFDGPVAVDPTELTDRLSGTRDALTYLRRVFGSDVGHG
ncbi:MAG: sugar phosphate isomerase/epimerase family protein [Tepidisphaerales bacterium]